MGKKILVSAYAISPTRGSEYSVAWNYINEMSKENSLVILYGVSGNHMGDVNEMETWLKSNSIPNVRFIPILPNAFTAKLNLLNEKGIFPYAFYFAFRFWQLQLYDVAKQLIDNEHFDLVHYLNPIGYREPGYLWKIDIPYIWGPVGGVPNRPKQLFKSLSIKDRLLFTVRNWANTFQFNYNRRLKKAFDASDLLLTATSENNVLIKKKYKKPSIHLPENGIANSNEFVTHRTIQLKEGDLCNILWIGRIDANKSLNFLIEALSNVKIENWHLHVVGDGTLVTTMKQLAVDMQIMNKISWHGHIPRNEVFTLLQSSHLHIITSLGEATTTVLFEAMSNAIPTITLNHCGMKDVVCEKCGVKIDIHSVDKVINDLTIAISDLVAHPDKINKLSMGVQECAKLHTWDHRRQLFNVYYDMAIENWRQKNILK